MGTLPPDIGLDDSIIDNEVGIGVPESTPLPPGAASATMPTMSRPNAPPPGGGGGAMDSMITDFLISKFGGQGVQGANAPAPLPPLSQAQGGELPPPPPPRTGSANAAPMASTPPTPPSTPPQAPLTMQDITKRGALQKYLPDVINAFLPTPEQSSSAPPSSSPSPSPRPTAGSANAAYTPPAPMGGMPVPLPRPRPSEAPIAVPPPTTGSANAASQGSMPASTSWMDIVKSVLSGGGTTARSAIADAAARRDSAAGSGAAKASGAGVSSGNETTGDELAVRRMQAKNAAASSGDSGRYSRPTERGGVDYKPPAAPASKRQAPRVSQDAPKQRPQAAMQKRQGQAPQTARSGRSAYAQSLIDSMGPRGVDVTTYIEPATGNEILTGGGLYMNLGKTSTGMGKSPFTKFFN